jgi:creatinine amidohydrolase
MTSPYLDQITWPEVKKEIQNGRDTVIVPFGATEQHGPHLPLGTDSVLGKEIGRRLAEHLNAFLAPEVCIGCSQHHLAFTGTISLTEETFKRVVLDIVDSLSRHGFRRILLLPTHGGNFQPLAEAVKDIKPEKGRQIIAFTDLSALVGEAFKMSESFGVDKARSGIHSGEWETSLMLWLRPEQVKMDRARKGFVGELSEILSKIFDGIDTLDKNGVLGDPRPASAAAGKQYMQDIINFFDRWLQQQDQQQ